MSHKPTTRFQRACALTLAALVPLQGLLIPATTSAQVRLADQPVLASNTVPGNLALALSVEFPTVSRTAHVADYSSGTQFLGYFDPEKCYSYVQNTAAAVTDGGVTIETGKGDQSYFNPVGKATNRVCSGQWSGNFLNWASLTAIDPFRWAMTGGRRVVDTASTTIVEKGYNYGHGYFPTRDQNARTEGRIPLDQVAGATPFSNATSFSIEVNGRGFAIRVQVAGATATNRTFNVRYFNAGRNANFDGQAAAVASNASGYHDWGNNSPAAGVNADFAAEFLGTFTAPEAGSYYFRTNSDDGVRLWVDTTGTNTFSLTTIDNWSDHGPTEDNHLLPIVMTAGQRFSLRIRYFDSGGGAVMQLSWRKPSATGFSQFSADSGTFDYTMRAKVCDPSASAGGVESNCKQYGSNWKPEGLIQKYSQDIRFSAFGYLNETGNQRDGAVMRARQKFVGPTQPLPGQSPVANSVREWDETTGVLVRNPDAADATNTTTAQGVTVLDSGVMNYLNKFGQIYPGAYKGNDPVNELYYAALRYFRNLGDVSAWSNLNTTNADTQRTRLDGFPVIRNWGDPIIYSCQRNFILGIGDIYTHNDKNVPGGQGDGSPAMPAFNDMFAAQRSTNRVKSLQGMGENLANQGTGSSGSTDYMAGLAFEANARDIRTDLDGKQTVQTYWVDVLEAPFVTNNKFYLAAKFGGMKLPADFDLYTFAGTIQPDWWSTTTETVGSQRRPDNYFTAGRPDTMVAGLTRAFESIVGNIKAYTTSFSLATKQITAASTVSYATQYDSADWSSELTASQITIDSNGNPVLSTTPTWSTATRFESQLDGTGWDTGRRIVTWNPDATRAEGVPFRINTISSAQKTALDTSYVAGDDSANYLNWLRGDPSLETGGYRSRATTSSTGTKRKRLGDIVNSKITVVSAPPAEYSETVNPGYRAFKKAYESRQTMLYVGANDGMLHAFKGGSGTDGGTELFAYVPSALFQRNPTDTTAPPNDGMLAQLGRPTYLHRNYVDANAKVYDIDFNNTHGNFTTRVNADGTTTASWRSVLIGGMGKGGRSYYAIDVTDPSAMTSETAVAGKVLWEFPAKNKLPEASGGTCKANCIDMGYSFGDPIVVKTAKHGWVVIFSSGYNNVDGKGHLFVVNPSTGELLQDISTGATASSGMARPTAYVRDYTDMTADSVYVGDLNGQLWRFDLTAARTGSTSYAAPTRIALLKDASGTAQPVTSRPLIEIHPVTRKRFVLVGTGRLLHSNDIQDAQGQNFYGIMDGGIAAFAAQANDGVAYPVARSQLVAVVAPDANTPASANVEGKAGWMLDLGSTGNVGWRIVGDQTDVYNGIIGIVSFPSLLPTGDACSPSGRSRAYALNYANGKSVLENKVAYMDLNTVVTDLNFVTIKGQTKLVAGNKDGGIQNLPGNFGDQDPRRLSWREIPVGN